MRALWLGSVVLFSSLVAAKIPLEKPEALSFPASFRFGTATAGFRSKWAVRKRPSRLRFPSDWTDYVTRPGACRAEKTCTLAAIHRRAVLVSLNFIRRTSRARQTGTA